jgi:hypothetical protein
MTQKAITMADDQPIRLSRRSILQTGLTLGAGSLAYGQTGQGDPVVGGPVMSSFESRRKWVMDAIAADPQGAAKKSGDKPFFVASACFMAGLHEAGRTIAAEAYQAWWKRLTRHGDTSEAISKQCRIVDFFRLWPAMDCYVRWKDQLDETTRTTFRDMMTRINSYAFSTTANLNTMAWTTRLLGEQTWGRDAFVPLVRDTTSHYKSNPDIPFVDRLLSVVSDIAITGGPEYASRPYGTANFAPLLTLSHLAADDTLRLRAAIAHETMLARYAAVWLRGSIIMTSRRSYPDVFNDPWGFASYLWLFFGGDLTPGPLDNAVITAAVLGTAPHPLIDRLATDRSRPFAVLNRFEPRSSGRQISWIDRDFGVFSESFHTKPRPFGQTYPMGVRWINSADGGPTLLWFSVPSLDQAGKAHISHPHGFNLAAQSTFQHQASILFLCNTSPNGSPVNHPYGLSFVPGGYLALIDESATAGRIFLHYPSVLIAFASTKPFTWDRSAPIRMPVMFNYPGAKPGSEFRIEGPTFAAAIEAASPHDFPAADPAACLQSFRDAMTTRTHLDLHTDPLLTGSYTNRHGTVISRAFHGPAHVNQQPIDLDNWPVSQSPLSSHPWRSRQFKLGDAAASRIYDFDRWTITDTP